jgi:hypothetical protein
MGNSAVTSGLPFLADLLDRAGDAHRIVGRYDEGVELVAGQHVLDLAVLLGRVERAVIDRGLDAELLRLGLDALIDLLVEAVLRRCGEKRDLETVGERRRTRKTPDRQCDRGKQCLHLHDDTPHGHAEFFGFPLDASTVCIIQT